MKSTCRVFTFENHALRTRRKKYIHRRNNVMHTSKEQAFMKENLITKPVESLLFNLVMK